MRFDLNQTNAQSFVFSLPDAEGRPRVLGFEYITDLGGAVEHSPRQLTLQGASANGFRLTEVDWHTGHVHVTIDAPASVSGAHVDARVPLGLRHGLPIEGRVTLRLLDAEGLQIEGPIPRLSGGVRIAQLAVEQSGEGGAASVGSLAVHGLQTTVAGFRIQLGTGTIDDVEVAWTSGGMELRAGSAAIDKLTASSGQVEISAERIAVARPVSTADGQVRIDELSIDEITLTIDQLSSLFQGGGQAGGKPGIPLDPRLLDLVSGSLEIDANVDASVPIIGRRRATHAFRVPIEGGTLDYKRLERGLSALEDAVIDFEVKGSRLVIERDIPIIRMRKDLVEWYLDGDELALARQRRVRLRTLPRYQLVSEGGGDIELKGLRLDPIDIDLTVGTAAGTAGAAASPDAEGTPPGASSGQDPEQPAEAGTTDTGGAMLDGVLPQLAIASLEIAGALCHPDAPGLLTVTAHQLAAALRDLPLGNMALDVGELSIESLGPAQITCQALRPDALSVTIRGVRLRDVILRRRDREGGDQ